MDYSKFTRNGQFLGFLQNQQTIPQIDFENKSLDAKIKELLKEESYKHYYQASFLVQKYGVKDLLKLRKNYSQFDNLQFIQEIVTREFHNYFYDSTVYPSYSPQKQSQLLEEIEKFVASNFGRDSDLTKTVRFMNLIILYNQNEFNDKLFTDWIKDTHYTHHFLIYDPYHSYNSPWNNFLARLDGKQPTDSTLIEKLIEANLEHISIKLGEDITKKYSKYIVEAQLQSMKAKIDYLNNKKVDDNPIALQVVSYLQSQTYIQMCHYNKPTFKVDEEIFVHVDVKNVQKMQVKVFEVNTDNYFRKKMSNFTSDINLDGLIAKHEQDCNYADKPTNLKHKEIFSFPQFNGQRGLFVVEIIGNGISSRSIIQKGNLSLIHKRTIAGHFAFLLDEEKNICKGGSYTGLYFDNNFYPADASTGRIIIPFGRHTYTGKAIMIYEGFSQLTDFQREDERYTFNASFVLHNESVIMGNLAKILVKPTLILNERDLADLRLLENTKVTLQTVNKVDNITISKSYEDVKLNDEEEYEIEFQVPPNIAEINVTVSTTVNVVTKGEKKNFSQSQNFTVNNHSNDHDFCEAFLRNVDGEYQYIIRGKNGETKTGVLIDFTFTHNYYYTTKSICLKTDKDGIVHLGRLKNIKFFTANPRSSRIVRSVHKIWMIPQTAHLTYPNGHQVTILESESVKLPFQHKELKYTNFQLLQFHNGVYIENQFEKTKLVKNPANKQGVNYIEIGKLEEGDYKVWLKKENVTFNISVHKGAYWNHTQDFLMKERAMIERQRQRIDCLRVDSVTVTNAENDIDEHAPKEILKRVHVALGGDYNKKKTRVHAWAFKFFPYDLYSNLTEKFGLRQQLSIFSANHFNFTSWKNIYLSNRQMSDENRYIMERKMQEKTIGNFLEKPTVLLKRNYIRDTTFNQEKLNQGQEYERIQAQAQAMSSTSRMMAGSAAGAGGGGAFRQPSIPNYQNTKQIEGFHNFLANSADAQLNIKVDEDGVAEFEMNLEPYTTLFVVATSEEQSTHLLTPIESAARKQMPQRDLSLLRAYNQELSFAETRRTSNCLKGDKFAIEDITSTDMQIVDSLQKVWLVQKELRRFSNEEQELIDSMLKWPTLTAEQKSKTYSEYCSHEFNLFLKLKDEQFFETAVRPFLTNKIEKTFVDYWILDFDFALEQFLQPEKLTLLNTFEVCLLIQYLAKKGDEKSTIRAKELATSIKERNNPPSIDAMSRIYDVVLNMNSLNSKPSGSEDIMEQLKKEKQQAQKKKEEAYYSEGEDDECCAIEENCCEEEDDCDMGGGLFGDDYGEEREEEQEAPKMKMARRSSPANQRDELKSMVQNQSCLIAVDPFAMNSKELQQVRQTQKLAFKELENTKEYAETHYYKVKARQLLQPVEPNCFWVDVSSHLLTRQGFKGSLSSNFTLALNSLNEAALAFALIDLPFKEESHGFRSGEGRSVEIKAASNMVIFLKEIQEADTKINKDLLVVHRYFEKGKTEREVQEFLINEVYQCQVIVTNISNKSISFQALTQVPEGSLPLNSSHYQKSHNFSLGAFSTMQFVYYFYFPKTGVYKHFPTNVSVDRIVVAKAPNATLRVQKSQTQINEDDFDDILATGSIPNILNFMKTKNIHSSKVSFNLHSVYWLCKDATFYKEGIQILKTKSIFDKAFYSFSIQHNDIETMREFFNSKECDLKRRVGSQFQSKLVQVNSHEESHDIFNFLDYFPLVNARAHRVGGMESSSSNSSSETKQWILNQNLRETYMKFMVIMAAKKEWTAHDRLQFVNYLLMQERVTEAVTEFGKIKDLKDDHGDARIQYDYIKAYLDFYVCGKSGSLAFTDARAIVGKYINYPVLHWRVLFKEIAEQLKEIDESYKPPSDVKKEEVKFDNFEDNEQERKRKQVKVEPQMDFTVDAQTKAIIIDYINVSKVRVNYYLIDLEILFSKTPFINSDTQDFSFVQPFQSEEVGLDVNQTTFKFPIPADLAKRNLVIELAAVESNGIKQIKTYFSATLKVRVIENFGELKVFMTNEDSGQDIPLPKTYVKVYSRKAGNQVVFFKDGYTDLRGRFDYGQLSGTSIADVERFAIFVHNDEHGSLIKEAKPPSGAKK